MGRAGGSRPDPPGGAAGRRRAVRRVATTAGHRVTASRPLMMAHDSVITPAVTVRKSDRTRAVTVHGTRPGKPSLSPGSASGPRGAESRRAAAASQLRGPECQRLRTPGNAVP
eukprot:765112-Hanusia_phi.AAC.9